MTHLILLALSLTIIAGDHETTLQLSNSNALTLGLPFRSLERFREPLVFAQTLQALEQALQDDPEAAIDSVLGRFAGIAIFITLGVLVSMIWLNRRHIRRAEHSRSQKAVSDEKHE